METSELEWEVRHLASGPGLLSVPFAGPSVPIRSMLMGWTTLPHPFRFKTPEGTGTVPWPVQLHPQGRKSISWQHLQLAASQTVVGLLGVYGAWIGVLAVHGDEGHPCWQCVEVGGAGGNGGRDARYV